MKLVLLLAICTAVIVHHGCVHAAVDKTLIPGEGGTDVVRAVLNKIDSSEVFSGEPSLADAFMRRMAFVESEDGDSEQYPEAGGIWNIDEATFMETKTYTSGPISNVYASIDSCFDMDWMNMDYEELQKPINSGLATRLYLYNLERTEGEMVPVKSEQANYWMTHFPKEGEDGETWNEAINELDNRGTKECSVNTDVAFVIDESGSIGADNFELVKSFTYAFIDSIKDSVADKIALIVYSGTARVKYSFSSPLNNDKSLILQSISSLPYGGGSTNTPDGLCMLLSQPWRTGLGVLRLAVVITDGRSNTESVECGALEPTANRVHNLDPPVQVLAIGIGDGVVYSELEIIASDPSLISNVTSFTIGLIESQEIRSYEICNTVDQEVTVGQLNNGTSGEGETTRLSFESSPNEGITLRLCIMRGSMFVFVSTTIRNPNAALNEFSAKVNSTNLTSINCLTNYFGNDEEESTRVKRRSTASGVMRLSVSLLGLQASNVFSLNTSHGNMTYDVDECTMDPCHKDASCTNTDGSFFCLCNTGYVGNGSYCEAFNCSSLLCSHGCNDTSEGPICYCPSGYRLGDDEITCQVCPGGYWGPGCSNKCNCSSGGNPCDRTTGVCNCNPCYSGRVCETAVGSQCFVEFLGIADKLLDKLQQQYGGDAFPTPPSGTVRGLIAGLMEVDPAIILDDVELTPVLRDDVIQGLLITLTWTVDYNVNRPEAEGGLKRLRNKVKLGDIRATLIIQELVNTALVTINAGIN